MKPVLLSLSIFATMLFLSSCGEKEAPTATKSGKLSVQATNYPLFYFAQRIAGDFIDLEFRAPGDIDPAFWEPTDEDISAMQNADLILMNGATYEKWAETVSLPTNTQVDTSKPFSQAYVTEKGGTMHSHGDGVYHSHDGIAFTTWLNLEYAMLQAEQVRDALLKKLPDQSDKVNENAQALATELAALDESLQTAGEKLKRLPLVGSHPVYQYLARRYKLDMRSVHWEPDVVPDAAAIDELNEKLEAHSAKHMLWEGAPATETVEILKKKGIESVVFNPCGNRPDEGDFLSVMKQNVAVLSGLSE